MKGPKPPRKTDFRCFGNHATVPPVRDARPGDWFIAGLFFTLGAAAAGVLIGVVLLLVSLLGFGALLHR